MDPVNWSSGREEAVTGSEGMWQDYCNASVAQYWAVNLLNSASNKSVEETLALCEYGLNNISSSSSTPAVDNGTWEERGSRGGDELYRHTVSVSTVYVVAYVTVFLLGLVGNCFVVAVVYRMPRMRTVTNYFIVNLAVADILVLLFCLPATLLSNVFVPWMLGGAMCKLVAYVQGVSVVASVDSLVAVSFDRFLAICFPMKFQITNRRARIILAIIWVLALTTTIPWPLYFNLVPVFRERPDIYFCVEQWPIKRAGTLYFVLANLVFCFLFPLALISLCYIMIWIKVWRRDIPTDSKDPHMERMQQRSKVKTVKMLVAVVFCFVLSWLPLYAIFTRIKLGNEFEEWEISLLAIATPIAQWLGSSNSCINPILYAFFNQKYRRGFAAIMKSRSCCGTLRVDDLQYRTPALSIHRSTYQSSTSVRRNTLSTRHRENNSSPSNVKGNSGVSQIYRDNIARKSMTCANV